VLNTIAVRGGISIDQLMSGIGEVWYFSSKTGVFPELMVPPGWVLSSIVCGGGISIDQLMLGIPEVWYFSWKISVFSRIHGCLMVCIEQMVYVFMSTVMY